MVKTASSPSSSPVNITVLSGGGRRRNMGLTSPVPRASVYANNPASTLRASDGDIKETGTECVSYTVQIPPTPDRKPLTGSNDGKSSTSFIPDTIFIGGYNLGTPEFEQKARRRPLTRKVGVSAPMISPYRLLILLLLALGLFLN